MKYLVKLLLQIHGSILNCSFSRIHQTEYTEYTTCVFYQIINSVNICDKELLISTTLNVLKSKIIMKMFYMLVGIYSSSVQFQ